jgi:hypothetical protein
MDQLEEKGGKKSGLRKLDHFPNYSPEVVHRYRVSPDSSAKPPRYRHLPLNDFSGTIHDDSQNRSQ